MNATRQQLHNIIDLVNVRELNVLYQVLIKFMSEDEATPDEIEAIRIGREEFKRGETINHYDIDWD
ncbi:MAG: hypothetical protein FWG90_04770 [Oscillospiraceae bacterium]|nr:hypothetical protein [Oscillospiraceae bacterium]